MEVGDDVGCYSGSANNSSGFEGSSNGGFSHFGSEEEKEEGGSCVGISNSQADMDTYPFSKLNLLLTQINFLIIN